MDLQSESSCVEEQTQQKNSSSVVNQNSCERNTNDVMVVYEYENEETNDDYDLALDGFILDGCSKWLYRLSLILLPLMLLLIIFTAIFSSESLKGLRCKIGKVFIVLGISVAFLAFYFLCRYGLHIRRLYRNQSGRRHQANHRTQQTINGLNKSKISKKQLKYLLQNPWHRVTENEPKEKYSNRIDVYVENGLYVANNDIV